MKIRDEAMWQQARAEVLAHDGDLAEPFLAFVTDWAERAESQLEFRGEDGSWSNGVNPAQALRNALPAAEWSTGGAVSLSVLAQAMITLMACWAHGRDVWAHLSPIEAKMVGDMMAIKYTEMETEAAAAGG